MKIWKNLLWKRSIKNIPRIFSQKRNVVFRTLHFFRDLFFFTLLSKFEEKHRVSSIMKEILRSIKEFLEFLLDLILFHKRFRIDGKIFNSSAPLFITRDCLQERKIRETIDLRSPRSSYLIYRIERIRLRISLPQRAISRSIGKLRVNNITLAIILLALNAEHETFRLDRRGTILFYSPFP